MSELKSYPLLPLRGMVVFPFMVVNLDVGRPASIAAMEQAMLGNQEIFLVAQKDPDLDEPKTEDLNSVGTVATIKQMLKLTGGAVRLLVEGSHRGIIKSCTNKGTYVEAEIEAMDTEVPADKDTEVLLRTLVHEFERWLKLSKRMPPNAIVTVNTLDDPVRMSDIIIGHLDLKFEEQQQLLEIQDIRERLELLYSFIGRELDLLEMEKRIRKRVAKRLTRQQKEYYLHEQMRAIRIELGEDEANSGDKYKKQLNEGNYPEYVKKTVTEQITRLGQMANYSSEADVVRTYIEWLLKLPWDKETPDNTDIIDAERILDEDHYGLKKVKERILEFLAVHKLVGNNSKAPILCLVGPPGVGKTSLASSVARAIGRKFVRASLGGVRDEAAIRGHRRTYVGAIPGRIIENINKVETKNPVFLLDEIDKIAGDYKGDPTAALLEVLDPAQNSTFTDNYLDVPFDLSKVFWIVTANDLGGIPRPLRDRMEIITLSSYTENEKLEIAKRYLVNRCREENGLQVKQLQFGKGVIEKMIDEYTRESGVRELERVIGRVCMKSARQLVEGTKKTIRITTKNLVDYLGKPKFPHSKNDNNDAVGVVSGMAWTEVGGTLLPVEATVLKGKGKISLTGQLGDVMQESAQAGISYIRSRSKALKIPENFYEKNDIHIHCPEGAVPKDGPSAGITIATAVISALTGKKVRGDVAMTGEITLRGRVMAIGGLKEKVLAAYREGKKIIILPKENERDIDELPEIVRDNMKFIPTDNMDTVLKNALVENAVGSR